MATIKVKFRPSTVVGHEGTVYYQVIHERKVRQLVSDHHVMPSEWDAARSSVIVTRNSCRERYMRRMRELIRLDVARFAKVIRKFEADGMTYSADDVIDEYYRYSSDYLLSVFMDSIIHSMKCRGRLRTSETYRSALNSFTKFLDQAPGLLSVHEADMAIDRITPETMEAYEAWLRRRGVTPNTISFYARILRAVYNRAVEQGITENRFPFRHVYTGIDKTVKRALPIEIIKRIKSLDLAASKHLDYARDMFMMSFYLRGMSFIDMAFLRKADLSDGFITYRRRKTGQRLIIGWTREMQSILDKYRPSDTDYLLPILKNRTSNERYAYLNASYNINRSLKKIAAMLGLDVRLTMYVARHSWASAARSKGIPLSVISEGMGHDSETTTRIYLASLDTSVVDRANSLILSSL